MKEIQITVNPGANFTPAGLMQKYAKQTPGAEFASSVYDVPALAIRGTAYRYHHWEITGETVTLFLLERDRYESINNMCRNCLKLDNGCEGTNCQTWTGCAMKERVEA